VFWGGSVGPSPHISSSWSPSLTQLYLAVCSFPHTLHTLLPLNPFSSHTSLLHSMTIPLTLFCVVHGDLPSNAFSVKISGSETVDELRNMIKAKKLVDFKDLDADRLRLWRVLLPMGLGTQHCAITLDAHSWPQGGIQPEELLPTARLHALYPEGAPEGVIHIIVQRPAQGTRMCHASSRLPLSEITQPYESSSFPNPSFHFTHMLMH